MKKILITLLTNFASLMFIAVLLVSAPNLSINQTILQSDKIQLDGLLNIDNYSNIVIDDPSENLSSDDIIVSIEYNPTDEFHCLNNSHHHFTADDILTVEERNQHRDELEKYYKEQGNEYIEKIDLVDYFDLVISEFTPHIRFYFDDLDSLLIQEDFLLSVDEDESIVILYIGTEEIYDSHATRNTANSAEYNWNDVLADHGLTSLTKTGAGINIGNLENSLPDNYSNFSNSPWYVKLGTSYSANFQDRHARTVASIYGGNNGIAPNTNVHFASLNDSDIVARTNYLVSSPVFVDILNMSAGFKTPGTYAFVSSYVDKLVNNTKVSFIASAGNYGPSTTVVSPATGLNVISVSSHDKNLNISNFSSSGVALTQLRASRISAAGGNLRNIPNIPNDIFYEKFLGITTRANPISGTSFSAPIVTGIVALLMEEFPILRANPGYVQTALYASANLINGQILPWDNDSGAGRANYARAREICLNDNYLTVKRISGTSGSIAKSIPIVINRFSTAQFSAINIYNSSWNGTEPSNGVTASAPVFTKYRLELLNSSGTVVVSDTGNSNTFFLRYTNNSSSNNFTLRLVQVGNWLTNGTDNIVFSSHNSLGVSNLCSHSYGNTYFARDFHYHIATCTSCGYNKLEEHDIAISFPHPVAFCTKCHLNIT